MGKNIFIIIGIIALIVVGVFLLYNKQEEPEVAIPVEQEELESLVSTLLSQDDGKEIGALVFTEIEGETEVVVKFAEDVETAHPAHLHSGSCYALGEIQFSLNDVVEGFSRTMLNTLELQDKLPLVLNVHKSEDELDTSIFCVATPS